MSVPWYLMAKGKGGGGYKTASGPIVSVNDALAAPLRSLVVNIEPVQEGTGDPSPDNVRPISGWNAVNVWRTGKNLFGESIGRYLWASGVRYPADTGSYCAVESKFAIKGGQTYSVSFTNSETTNGAYVGWFNGDTYLSQSSFYNATSGTVTAPSSATHAVITFRNTEDYTGNPTVSNVMFELGSTATAYEPYSGNQYTLQLGQTVYGGTLDVTNGVLTVDRAMVDLGTLNWTYNTTYAFFTTYSLTNRKVGTLNIISDLFKTETRSWSGTPKQNALWGNGSNATVYVQTPLTSVEDFLVLVTGHQLVYELSTPLTIPLTPTEISTLQGQNNLWADSGDVTVEYLSSGGTDPDLMKLAVAFMGRK